MPYGTNSLEVNEPNNGGGWENKVSVSSLRELREQLTDLSGILSVDDNAYGVNHAHVNIQGNIYGSDADIDSYRSYLTAPSTQQNSTHAWGGYHYNGTNNPDTNSLELKLNYNNIYQSIASANRAERTDNTYLAFDIEKPHLSLSNGFNYQNNAAPYASRIDKNPEYVITLNDDFFADFDKFTQNIEDQKKIGDDLNFKINGLTNTNINLSTIKNSANSEDAISDIVDQLRFTVETDQSWELPFYSQIDADLHFKGSQSGASLNFRLLDHDAPYNSGFPLNGQLNAIESKLDSTVFEFGLENPYEVANLIRGAQENYNLTNTNTILELSNLSLNFRDLPGGGSYHLNVPKDSFDNNLPTFEVSPYHNYNTDFSNEGGIQLLATGNFDSVIDVWQKGEDGPQFDLKIGDNGISQYQNAHFNLNFEATLPNGSIHNMHVMANAFGAITQNLDISNVFSQSLPDVIDYKLKSISYDATPWNIRTSNDPNVPLNGGQHVHVTYNVDDQGVITVTNPPTLGQYQPNIQDIIPNIESLKNLSLTGLNDLSYQEQLNASIELGFEGNQLPWNTNPTVMPPTNTLETYYSFQELDQLAILGDSVDMSAKYDLTITAKMLGELKLEGADLTIEFEADHFNDLVATDIKLGGAIPTMKEVEVDNANGTIRIAAASLSDLNHNYNNDKGTGISEESVFASISFDFDETALRGITKNSDGSLSTSPLSFKISADSDETVFSRDHNDSTGYDNREILSLRDLGKDIIVEGRDVTLYEAKINLEQLDDGLVLGTQRVIGANTGTTNLIRSGDTITTDATWRNIGNITARNLQITGETNSYAYLDDYRLSTTSINSGSFQDGEFVEEGREDVVLSADIKVTGQAGDVVNMADGILSISADGSEIFSNTGKGSANLITYQGDLNYDGRVSMKDLAFLNAGAARQVESNNGSVDAASVARDVDADFSGKIDIADLSILDQDWGKSLHTGTENFTGSSASLDWTTLEKQGDASWDNSSFTAQNAIEAQDSYIGSLDAPASTGVIGTDGNTASNDGDMQGTQVQDQLAA